MKYFYFLTLLSLLLKEVISSDSNAMIEDRELHGFRGHKIKLWKKIIYEKCQSIHPRCSKCSWGYKYCSSCESPYKNVNGKCVIPIHFDDLNAGKTLNIVPNGHKNLDYENLYFMNSKFYQHSPRDSGYVHGTVSKKNVGYTGYAKEAFIRALPGKTFSLCSMKLTPAWKKNVTVWIGGYNSTGLVASKKFYLKNPCYTTHAEFDDFKDLTELMICPWGGENVQTFKKVVYSSAAYVNGTGAHVAIDNILIY